MNEETGAAVPESTSGPAVFEKQIEIRTSRGHVKNLPLSAVFSRGPSAGGTRSI